MNFALKDGKSKVVTLSYDVSRVEVGASYRGSIVLIPTEKVLLQGESVVYELVFEFSENKPDEGELDEYNTCYSG